LLTNTILLLVFIQWVLHKFGCNTMHAQIFSEDLMACWFLKLCLFLLLQERPIDDWNESLSELFDYFLQFLML
jgi:hypothetical protein